MFVELQIGPYLSSRIISFSFFSHRTRTSSRKWPDTLSEHLSMNLLRAWNTYVPTQIRRNEFIPIILFVLAILAFVWLGHVYRYNWRSNTFCQSEINYRSLILNKSRIHMLPPSAPRMAAGELLHAADDIYNNECVEVFGPQKNGPLLICIHDPKRDLMISAHLKVCQIFLLQAKHACDNFVLCFMSC